MDLCLPADAVKQASPGPTMRLQGADVPKRLWSLRGEPHNPTPLCPSGASAVETFVQFAAGAYHTVGLRADFDFRKRLQHDPAGNGTPEMA